MENEKLKPRELEDIKGEANYVMWCSFLLIMNYVVYLLYMVPIIYLLTRIELGAPGLLLMPLLATYYIFYVNGAFKSPIKFLIEEL